MKTAVSVTIWALLFLLVIGLAIPKPGSAERAKERDVIDKCLAAVDDELSELETRRFMRQACRELEAEYRRKWGRDP